MLYMLKKSVLYKMYILQFINYSKKLTTKKTKTLSCRSNFGKREATKNNKLYNNIQQNTSKN